MILHFTGSDCSGKSTICNEITKMTNGIYTHFDKPKDLEDGKKQYYDFLNNVDISKIYVCDRFHDGEWVYAPLYRGYTGDYLEQFENDIRDKDTYLLIYVTAQLETLLNRAGTRGEDFVKEEDFQKVLDNFKNNYMRNQTMPFIWVDTTTNPLENTLERVINAKDTMQIISAYLMQNKVTKPQGNLESKYMIIDDNYKEYIEDLKNIKEYFNCWFTTSEDNMFIKLQHKLINPEYIVVLNEDMKEKVESILPRADVIYLKDICKN